MRSMISSCRALEVVAGALLARQRYRLAVAHLNRRRPGAILAVEAVPDPQMATGTTGASARMAISATPGSAWISA